MSTWRGLFMDTQLSTFKGRRKTFGLRLRPRSEKALRLIPCARSESMEERRAVFEHERSDCVITFSSSRLERLLMHHRDFWGERKGQHSFETAKL